MQHTLSELAELCDASLVGDGSVVIVGPAALGRARPDEICFYDEQGGGPFGGRRYKRELAETRAGALVVREGASTARPDLPRLVCANPSATFDRIVQLFCPPRATLPAGVHPSAVVDPEARLGTDVGVGALAVIGPGASLADGARVHPNATVGPGAQIGADTVLHPGVVVYDGVRIGARCIVHACSVIGADGYGFKPTPDGWVKIPQLGTVLLEDDVEVGAGCTIDRGRFGPTVIGQGTKLDDQVHVAHNVEIGAHTMAAAQVGIAGSARVGSRVLLGGQAGVGGHALVGDGAQLAAKSGPFRDVEPGERILGYPGLTRGESLRQQVHLKRLPRLLARIEELEQRLTTLEARREAEKINP